jgi:hypothetical protein
LKIVLFDAKKYYKKRWSFPFADACLPQAGKTTGIQYAPSKGKLQTSPFYSQLQLILKKND